MDKLNVVKIGGNVIENKTELETFLADFTALQGPKLLVHGGGKKATQMAKKLNIPVQMINGRRVTDAKNLDIITMLYAGKINKNIVAQLQALKCNAIGLSGADGNSILATKRPSAPIDFGFVGDISTVNSSFFTQLLKASIVPVCCAISHDGSGQLLNTNADTIAAAIAGSLSKYYEVTLQYCFEKQGVLMDVTDETSVIEQINSESYLQLQKEGIIADGMLPKIHNCFHAIEEGVKTVKIGLPKMINGISKHTQIVE